MDIYLEQVYLTRLVEEVRTIVEPLVVKNGNKLVDRLPARHRFDPHRPDQAEAVPDQSPEQRREVHQERHGHARGFAAEPDRRGLAPRFAVTDSGIGMTEEQSAVCSRRSRRPTRRPRALSAAPASGSTITRHFATMLGGTIEVTSKPGDGSTFTCAAGSAGAGGGGRGRRQRSRVGGGARTGLTVLVVDDDPTVHDLLSATLAKEGYRILHARDGAEALDRCARRRRPTSSRSTS